jgi:prevent-host-death family protein
MDVLKVSAAEFQRNIGRYQDLALRQPIAVTRNGRESCVLLSTDEYRRLKRRDREVLGIDEFTDADAEAVRRAEAPAAAAAFDNELKP